MKMYGITLEDFSYRGQLENLLHDKVSFFSKKAGEDSIIYIVNTDQDLDKTLFGNIPVEIREFDESFDTDSEEVPFPQPEPDREEIIEPGHKMVLYSFVLLLALALLAALI